MPRVSNFLRNSIIRFRMFLYLISCLLRVTVSLLCRLQAVSKMHVPIFPYLISEGRRNCSTLWPAQKRNRDSQGTYVTKYKHMRKWIVEFLRKFESRGIKIARVNSILITKIHQIYQFTLILYGVGGPLWCWHF